MSLTIVLLFAVVLSIVFHFIGVYAGAKKTVWIMLLILWAASINIAMNEVKPKAYDDIKQMQGKYEDVDVLIKESLPKISLYEMLVIKKAFNKDEKSLH